MYPQQHRQKNTEHLQCSELNNCPLLGLNNFYLNVSLFLSALTFARKAETDIECSITYWLERRYFECHLYK